MRPKRVTVTTEALTSVNRSIPVDGADPNDSGATSTNTGFQATVESDPNAKASYPFTQDLGKGTSRNLTHDLMLSGGSSSSASSGLSGVILQRNGPRGLAFASKGLHDLARISAKGALRKTFLKATSWNLVRQRRCNNTMMKGFCLDRRRRHIKQN